MAVQYLRIQVRRDSKANWSTANPVLLLGEVGYETDTKRSKTGDGVHTWMNLPYDKAGIVAVGDNLSVDDDGVLNLTYDHSEDIGDLGDNATVKEYVDRQDAITLQSANNYTDAEKTARENGDAGLQAELNIVRGDADTVGSFAFADQAEEIARTNADNQLNQRVDINDQAIITEKERAEAAEEVLRQQVGGAQNDATNAGLAAAAAQTTANTALSKADANFADIETLQTDVTTAQDAADAAQADATANAGRLDVLEDTDPATYAGSVAEAKAVAEAAQATADTAEGKADANTAALDDKADLDGATFTGAVVCQSGIDGTLTGDVLNDLGTQTLLDATAGTFTGDTTGTHTGPTKGAVADAAGDVVLNVEGRTLSSSVYDNDGTTQLWDGANGTLTLSVVLAALGLPSYASDQDATDNNLASGSIYYNQGVSKLVVKS